MLEIRADPFLRKRRFQQLSRIENGTLRAVSQRMALETNQAPAVRKLSWPKILRERNSRKTRELKNREKLDALFDRFQHERTASVVFATLVIANGATSEGALVTAVGVPWFEILKELDKDPDFLFQFVRNPRGFEELIAGAYRRAGWPEVILTPRSGDKGRDIIVSKPGYGAIRFLEQTKAYKPGRLVTHDDVRSMLGVLAADNQASKGLITTTSGFQPNIFQNDQIQQFVPFRLELKDGRQTVEWLKSVAAEQATNQGEGGLAQPRTRP